MESGAYETGGTRFPPLEYRKCQSVGPGTGAGEYEAIAPIHQDEVMNAETVDEE